MTLPTIAVLAGGLATRLHPVTQTIPKSLVPVCGEPFIAHQLRLLKRQGFEQVVLLTGHFGEQIEAFVGTGSAFGLVVRYSPDGEVQRGTGGAVRKALPLLGDVFFLLYGDSYLDVEVEPIWQAYQGSGCVALMTVLHNQDRWDASNVVFDDQLVVRYGKKADSGPRAEWIDFGLSVFSSSAIAACPASDPFDLADLTSDLASRRALAGFAVDRRFYEIGRPQGLADTEAYLSSL